MSQLNSDAIRCPECYQSRPADARYCPGCGRPVLAATRMEAARQRSRAQEMASEKACDGQPRFELSSLKREGYLVAGAFLALLVAALVFVGVVLASDRGDEAKTAGIADAPDSPAAVEHVAEVTDRAAGVFRQTFAD